jgi:tetratricopeptide (TPR) repeat protein
MDVITSQDDFKLHEGCFCRQHGDFKRAIKLYKDGLKINSKNLVLLYETGLAYSKLQKPRKALKYWKKIVKIAPQSYLGVKVTDEININNQKTHWWGRIKWPIINK